MVKPSNKIDIENVNYPGQTRSVDRHKYDAVRQAYLRVLPESDPGFTPAEVRERLTGELPEELFPGGAEVGWWAKAVQLDLEAKGFIARASTRPVRLRKMARRPARRA